MDNTIAQGFRLSTVQQRLWRLSGGAPGSALHSRCALRLPGDLSRADLAGALRRTVARHEILRTAFPVRSGMSLPLQTIREAPQDFALPIVDLRALPPAWRDEAAAAVCVGLGEPAFDLESGAPLRAALTVLDDREQELALALPALCADLPTLEALAGEILARSGGGEPVQLADIAEWEYQLLEGEDTAEGVERWRELWRTAGITERLGDPLPLERSGAASGLFTPEAVSVPLAAEDAQAVTALAAAWGAPISDLALAAWQAVLWRSRGEAKDPEILIGVLHDGRRFEELHGALGPLARYLPVPASCGPQDTLRTLLERTRAGLAEAARRQQLFSWEHAAGADRDRFFPLCFQALGESQAPIVRRCSTVDRFGIELVCEGLNLELRHDPRRIGRSAAELLAERLATLLRSAAARPEGKIGELEIVGAEEARRIAADAIGQFLKVGEGLAPSRAGGEVESQQFPEIVSLESDPTFPPTREGASPSPTSREESKLTQGGDGSETLHHLFAAQAARTPERPAVVGASRSLTFADLDARANRLGHHLRSLGAGPERRVAVCLERSPDMVVAILGILKAGAAWVPVDPSHPADRLAFLLADAGASLVVTEQRLADRLRETGVRPVLLDADAAAIAARPAADPGVAVAPQSLAYAIYTSGSTGRPKGVLVEHRSPIALLAGLQAAALREVERPLRASLNAPLIFDASVQQLVLLLAGHTLYVIPEAVRTDGEALLAFLRENEIDLFDCTPSQLRLLLAAGLTDAPGPVPSIVLSAGEAMDEGMWQALGRSSRTAFYNIYGPTECTVDATARRVDRIGGSSRPSIGRPLAGYEAWVLDRELRPVPLGAPGEICLGGAGLARGYLGRPDATAERFVPHPLGEPGARLYRTGDLARHLPDGTLEFLGRADDQIKIRGYRIEPGEIETALAAHPWVREAVVIARQDVPGQALLTAYVALAAEAEGGLHGDLHSQLHTFLATRLPAYMIPAAFVPLAAFPLTPSGKVDRKALPAPDPARLAGGAHTPPRNPREAALAGVWAEVLGVDRIGIDDSFFAFGGDSIRSLQVQALAREQGVHFTVQQLFEHQTIRELAEAVDLAAGSDSAHSSPFSLISEEERRRLPPDVEDAYPLAQLQTGMVFQTELSPESGVYQDRFSFTLRGPLDTAALDAAAQRLAARHPILRTSFDLANPGGPLQRVHLTARLPFEVTDLRDLDPETRERTLDAFLEREQTLPFDWSRPPLLRIHVHRLDAERNQFTLTEHHSILDGWSVASLLAELFNLYRGVESAAPPPSPAASFREYVALERQALASPEHRAYWQRAVGDGAPTVLPRLGPPAAAGPLRHEVIDPEIPAAVADGLRALARTASVPLKTVLLAAHLRALAFLCGGTDVLTGLSSDGRPEEPGADRVLGIFVSMLPFRFRLAGGSWVDLARSVFAAERELLPFRRFPMAEVQRLHGGGSLFETAFNFVHFHVYQGLADAGDLQVERSRGFELLDLPLTANFGVDPFSGRITLGLNAHLDVLSHERLTDAAGYYLRTLTEMAADPLSAYDAVPLLSAEERDQALHAAREPWPASSRSIDPGEGGLHELFEAQAARTPEAIAAVCEGGRLTYDELDRAADRLADRLRAAGVGPEARVGIAMERSLDLVVSLLAVLKAGAAYVPLDPGYPRERLAFMLEDADLAVLLAQRHLTADLPESPVPVLFPEDADVPAEADRSRARFDGINHAAYMIYTSGSTGRPKGAVNTHRGIRNRLLWMQAAYGLTPEDRVLQKTPFSFDVSVWEFFWPLITGARLVLARPGGHLDPAYLARLISEAGVTTLHFVPSLLQLFLAEPDLEQCTALRRVICSGEALPAELARRFFERFPEPVELHNLYGPTEAAVDVTAWPCRREARDPRIPIGRPVANTGIHLLDPFFQLVPVGTPGELCIGGVQLARGYHGRPELTAERFVPDPFSPPGHRLYRTGDLARRLPDGTVDYLGRLDFQVKVRGVRIELGEIEAALRAHPAVRDAAVTVRDGQRLAAYVMPREEPAGTEARGLLTADLRDFLRARLPEPMLPSAFVLLDALPLTPSGKLDRRALPAPEAARPEKEAAFAAPRNETEELLAAIWAEVLGLARMGIDENFLELGGHSLFAMQLISRVRATFAVELPLRSLFEANTVAALALRVVTAQAEQADRAALERMLAELEGISDSEAQSLLATAGETGEEGKDRP